MSKHPQEQNIESKLKALGQRLTLQRLNLAKLIFTDKDQHMSADQLYQKAQEKGFHISLATIYNTLNQWAKMGLLRRVAVYSGAVYFDTNVSNHYHFYDKEKDDLIDLPSNQVQFTNLPLAPDGMQIKNVDVVIYISAQQKNK